MGESRWRLGDLVVDTAPVAPTKPAPTPPATLSPARILRTPLVLSTAELVFTLIEAGTWTRENFPPVQEMSDFLSVDRPTLEEALQVLGERQVLQEEVRWLPADWRNGRSRVSERVARVAEFVRERIRDGTWTAEDFPSGKEIRKVAGCRAETLAEAMKVLEREGLVHQVLVLRPPARGRVRVWRPVQVEVNDQADYTGRLRREILAGVLSGVLPEKAALATQYKVHGRTVEQALWLLADEGLVCPVWLRGVRSRVWYVPDSPPRADRCRDRRTRVETIADDVVLLVPQLRWIGVDGRPYQRRVPSPTALARYYGVSRRSVMSEALELLVARRVLVRVPRRDGRTAYELAPWPPWASWPPSAAPSQAGAGGGRRRRRSLKLARMPALPLVQAPDGTPLDRTVAWPPAGARGRGG